ncbi:MAG TPA: TonB-dependent receptor [Longimicrobiales bacterium]|nr:TonB-dependent receptor [Longimicrobiales bacterium]
MVTLALFGAWQPASAQQSGSIAGVVRPAEAQPVVSTTDGIAAVQVDALRADGGVQATVLTNEDGAFRLFVPPGSYTVVFTVPGWETQRIPVTVAAGETASLEVQLAERAFDLNPITVTASRTEEKALDAPAAVEVQSTRDIEEQPAITMADHVRSVAAVDVIKSGLQGNYVVVRGFNNIFSGATLTLTDNRIAGVPSLRANVLHLNPTSNLDIERIEVVLGPGSALYGPNAANGVIHTITKSPIDYPGGMLSAGFGMRQQQEQTEGLFFDQDGDGAPDSVSATFGGSSEPVYNLEGRYALRLGETVGIKASGIFFMGEEFEFADPEEFEQQAIADRCIAAGYQRTNPNCANFAQGLNFGQPGALETMIESVDNVAAGRDNGLERYAFDLRADWRPSEDLSFIASGGRTTAITSVDLTGLGGGQVVDWGYNYGQVRTLWRDLFAQVFFNQSDNTETYLLRSGRPLVDRSSLLVAQVQNMTLWADTRFVYGVDFLRTMPNTEGTINGRNEDDDDVMELGGYVQSETPLGDHFELTLAARLDGHSRLDEPVFSPRAAVVWQPTQGQNIRATYNRAFSTPTTLNLFLDISGGTIPLPAGLQYDVRAQGTTDEGLHFAFDENGVPMHRSPFALFFGGSDQTFYPTTTERVWDEVAAVVSASNPSAGAFLASLEPTESDVAIDIRTLNTATSTFASTPGGVGGIENIPQVLPTITNTFEVGYKGLIGENLLLGANAYYSLIDDFTSALRVVTPNVFLNPADIEAYLLANGADCVTATTLAVNIGGANEPVDVCDGSTLAPRPGLPIGVITAQEAGGTFPALMLTYQNLGRVELFGIDMSATVIVDDRWEIDAGLAFISDDEFVANEGEVTEETIPLNAPTQKATGSVRYRNDDFGVTGRVRGRYVNGFPANSGVYSGDVESYTSFDVTAGYRLPFAEGLSLTVDVQNVLNTDYQTFVGAPALGRFTLLRLMYEF